MKRAAVFFALFILAVVILADLNKLGPLHWIYDFPYGDKLGHFILFGSLNFFVTRAFLAERPRKQMALWVGAILALLIGAEEWSQRYFSSRTFDLIDLTASYFGLLVGGWIAVKTGKK